MRILDHSNISEWSLAAAMLNVEYGFEKYDPAASYAARALKAGSGVSTVAALFPHGELRVKNVAGLLFCSNPGIEDGAFGVLAGYGTGHLVSAHYTAGAGHHFRLRAPTADAPGARSRAHIHGTIDDHRVPPNTFKWYTLEDIKLLGGGRFCTATDMPEHELLFHQMVVAVDMPCVRVNPSHDGLLLPQQLVMSTVGKNVVMQQAPGGGNRWARMDTSAVLEFAMPITDLIDRTDIKAHTTMPYALIIHCDMCNCIINGWRLDWNIASLCVVCATAYFESETEKDAVLHRVNPTWCIQEQMPDGAPAEWQHAVIDGVELWHSGDRVIVSSAQVPLSVMRNTWLWGNQAALKNYAVYHVCIVVITVVSVA